jgi:large subunit ribosomal protein L29
MKKEEINTLDAKQLQESLIAEKENLRRLRFAHAISPIENPRRITHTRRLIARLNTAQRARELNLKQEDSHAKRA